MEERVSLFYKLHNNKWFHKMNHTLELIKMTDHSEKALLIKFGACFFDNYNKSTELKQGRVKKKLSNLCSTVNINGIVEMDASVQNVFLDKEIEWFL